MSERLLTAKQVADLLAVPESWVREATREARIPHLKLGRYRRYQPAAIQALLAQQGGARKTGQKFHWPISVSEIQRPRFRGL